MTVMPIIDGALGRVPKGLEKGLKESEIRGRINTIQSTVLQTSARILRRVLKRLAVTWTQMKDHQLVLV